jgi:LPXTG-motif cell wall-anchored protein
MSSDLMDGMEASTINGNNITVDLSNGVKINESMVVIADLDASNGVVHVIDQVLVPADFNYQEVNMNEDLPKTGDIGLIPFAVFGILSLGGYTAIRKKK